VRTALSLTAPITHAIFGHAVGHAVGDLAAHGEVLLAIERKDEQRAFDLMRGLLSHVARKVAEANTCPGVPIVESERRLRV
jgi:DNA-binding GntR family transcriptional regulator